MALAVLIAITLTCIAWSLWIRRVTWSCRWEVAATLNIALQGAAVLLMSPIASETVGHWLHAATGMWNLEDYVGHDMYIVAASAVVYNALGRLQDDHAMQVTFKQYVERPATICIPLLLATFSLGNGSRIYRADFFEVPTDFWLTVYWLLLCGMLIYLLSYGCLVASISGIAACCVRIVTALVPSLQNIEGGTFVWVFACGCGAGFALASAHSWRIRTKWFTKASR